jgi:membrane associated rhomboid family serine protease
MSDFLLGMQPAPTRDSSHSSHLKVYQLFFVLHCAGLLALRLALDGEHVKAIIDLLGIQSGGSLVSWQLLTHAFLHLNPLEFVVSTALLLAIGGSVERALGSARFTSLYIGSAAAAAVGFELLASPGPPVAYVGGLAAGCAVLVAQVLLEPRKRALGVIPAPGIFLIGATLILGLTIYMEQESARGLEESLKLPLAGAMTGARWMDLQWDLACRESATIPHLMGFAAGTGLFTLDLTVCWALARIRMRRQIQLLEEELDARERVDTLLEKISREGVHALSRREKKFLTYASARFYFDRKRVLSE